MLGTGIKHMLQIIPLRNQGGQGIYTPTSVSHWLRAAPGVENSPALRASCERVEWSSGESPQVEMEILAHESCPEHTDM